ELLIGQRPPEKERETRREIDIRDAIGSARSRRLRFLFEAEDEVRADQNGFERAAHATLESARRSRPGSAFVIERHQPIDLAGGQRTSIRVAAEARDDLPRARTLFARRRRSTREDLLTARRLGNSSDLVRPFDRE